MCGLRSGGSLCLDDGQRTYTGKVNLTLKMTQKTKNFCNFTTEMDEKLIQLVASNEVLYNTYHKMYKDLNVREDVWLAISTVVGKSVQECKTRWRSLRDLYHRKRKQERKGKSAKHPWEYMEALSFLENFTYERRSDQALKPEENIIPADDTSEETFNNCVNFVAVPVNEVNLVNLKRGLADSISDASTKRIKSEIDQEENETVQLLREIRDATRYNQNPIKTFFDSMAQTVINFPPALAVEAKLKVCQIITELECRILDSNAFSDTELEFQ